MGIQILGNCKGIIKSVGKIPLILWILRSKPNKLGLTDENLIRLSCVSSAIEINFIVVFIFEGFSFTSRSKVDIIYEDFRW